MVRSTLAGLGLLLAGAAHAAEPMLDAEAMQWIAGSLENPSARCDELYRIIATYPGTQVAASAEADLLALVAAHPKACRLVPPNRARPRAGGELELVLTQTVLGVGVAGIVLPTALGVEMATEMPGWLGMAGFAGGATAGLLSAQLRVTPGQAMAVTTGEALGAWNALGLEFITSTNADPEERRTQAYVAATAGTGIGAAAGALTAALFRPSAGDMALLRSGGTWGTLVAHASLEVAPPRLKRTIVPRLVVGTDAGAAAGLLLATQLDWSRERVNLVDVAGYAGLLGGWAASEGIGRAQGLGSPDLDLPLAAGGSVAGLALGALATRGMKGEGAGKLAEAMPKLQAAPQPDGSWTVGLGFSGEL